MNNILAFFKITVFLSFSLLIGCGRTRLVIPDLPAGYKYIPSSTDTTNNMGAQPNDPYVQGDELPIHKIKIDAFALGQYEVTVGEFKQFVKMSGYNYDVVANAPTWPDGKMTWLGNNHPMPHVSWVDAVNYCNWLSKKEGLQPCYSIGSTITCDFTKNGYRLPTEAEWEYACRAGQVKPYTIGNQGRDTITVAEANYGNAVGKTTPVGSYQPNSFGIYDMHGNLWEWCNDFYDPAYYSKLEASQPNPKGPETGTQRVIRGGWWFAKMADQRSSNRYSVSPDYRGYDIGFRVARKL